MEDDSSRADIMMSNVFPPPKFEQQSLFLEVISAERTFSPGHRCIGTCAHVRDSQIITTERADRIGSI